MRTEPEYSCPYFDEAIDNIERARGVNSRLRDDYRDMKGELEAAEEAIVLLLNRIAALEAQLETMTAEPLEVPAWVEPLEYAA